MRDLWQDLRFSARLLRRSRAFTLTVLVLLTLGIGANVLVFTVLDTLLFRPIPVRHPEQLYRIVTVRPQLGPRSDLEYPVYENLKKARCLTEVFGRFEWIGGFRSGTGDPMRVYAHLVTGNYFTALGVRPLHGRVLAPGDEQQSFGSIPAVLSYAFWQRYFHGDRSAVGRTAYLRGTPISIVGILPRGFHGITVETGPEVRIPVTAVRMLARGPNAAPEYLSYELAGRLAPGATLAQARAEVTAAYRSGTEAALRRSGMSKEEVAAQVNVPVDLEPVERGTSRLRTQFAGALAFVMATLVLLLVLVCASVAGLAMARLAARSREMGVRLALGATRARLIRQTLAESLLLASAGGVAALILAWCSAPLLSRALPPYRDLWGTAVSLDLDFTPNLHVFGIALALCAGAVLLCGLAPAIQSGRTSLDAVLRSARATPRWSARHWVIGFEAALCTVLLLCSVLLVRTFYNLAHLDPGFDAGKVVTFSLDHNMKRYDGAQARTLATRLMDRVRELPGVESTAIAAMGLMRRTGMKTTFLPVGRRGTGDDFLNTSVNTVSKDYFATLGMRVVAGRGYGPEDLGRKKPIPAVVNEAFARRFFPAQDPIGRAFGQANQKFAQPDYQIIGVVNDARYRSLREPVQPIVYGLWDPDPRYAEPFILHVRTQGDPWRLVPAVQRILREMEPELPFYEVQPLREQVGNSLWTERVLASVAAMLAVIAALLAAAGIHGLIGFTVAQRTREIGIRVALGSSQAGIVRLVSRQSVAMVMGGVVLGAGVTVALGPKLEQFLYRVSPFDAGTLLVAAVLVLSVTAAGSAIPALRAVRIEPAAALRHE